MPRALRIQDIYSGRSAHLEDTAYNNDVQRWAATTQRLAKQAAATLTKGKRTSSHTYTHGPKAGKTETRLRRSIQYKLQAEAGDISSVFFRFPVHGIFREYGVGRGSPRGHVTRSLSDWMSATLDRQEPQLVELVSNHEADRAVRLFNGIKK